MNTENNRADIDAGIRKRRGRMVVSRMNSIAVVLMIAAVAVMVNYLASRYYWRSNFSYRGFYSLSPKTLLLLENLPSDVNVISFFRKDNPCFDDINNLLDEYEYASKGKASGRVNVKIIEPDRDLAEARQLGAEYGVTEVNVIVFACGGRKKYVTEEDIVEYQNELVDRGLLRKKMISFKAEQVFSSMIYSVAVAEKPVVYFLEGHGERDIKDYDRLSGYSSIVGFMKRDSIEIKTLSLADKNEVPPDCSAIIVAGPDRSISQNEAELLRGYLQKNGRMLLMLDPSTKTGFEDIVEEWGLSLRNDVVFDPYNTLTGRELFVKEYGEHPITKRMKGIVTQFYMPRSIMLVASGSANSSAADRPRITMLASCSDRGWAETDLNTSPASFDEGSDTMGPVAVAAAIEKGPTGSIDIDIEPTRIVIVGDSIFVSNRAMSRGAGGNRDLFMNMVNWLLERENLMAIAPKLPGELKLDIDSRSATWLLAVYAVFMPGVVALIGVIIWITRRH